jgi:ubiquinone/menaquinone biosynthesis C-methylase UbiE
MAQVIDGNNKKIKQQIQRYWNGRAGKYDKSYGHSIFTDEQKQTWLDTLQRNLNCPKGAKVLDVGCGTGFLSLLLAELGFAVTGVDLAREMMAEGQKKAVERDLEIEFINGDAESPPVDAQSFQAVVSRHLLWTLPDPERAVANWMKLVVPGGRVVVIDGVWVSRGAGAKLQYKLADLIAFLKGNPRHSSWEKTYVNDPAELPFMGGAEPERVVELFNRVGFDKVDMDNMSEVVRAEKKQAPLEYSLRYSKKGCRYMVSGHRPISS